MIKRFGFVAFSVMLVLMATFVQAQKVADKGSAVKLGTGATVKNTIIWGNEGKAPVGITPQASYIQGIETLSPKFLDSLNGDFRLKKGSPCRDQGMDDAFFGADALDLWGNTRKTDRIDIGAHEYKVYKIHFIKDGKVKVEQLLVDGEICDSTAVEPNGTYQFKLDLRSIVGVTKDMVIVKKVAGDEKLDPEGADNIYTLSGVNSDITIQIILTPPMVVTVDVPDNGKLTATSEKEGLVIPKTDGSGKNSMVVLNKEFVRLDTVSDPGFYCNDVWAQETGAAGKTSVKANIGKAKGWEVVKSIVFSAEFLPKSYPVQLKLNDPAMGELLLTDSKGATYDLSGGDASLTKYILYDPALSFTVTVTENPGYEIASLTVYDADGISNPERLSTAQLTGQTFPVRIGGVVVELKLKARKYIASWTCQHGDLTVVPGTVENIPGGGKKTEVNYNEEITVTPVAEEGYEYVPGSLKVKPEGEAEVAMPATNKWQVKKNVVLSAQFVKKKYLITVNIVGDPSNSYVANPVLPADKKVEYGTALTLTPSPAPGYSCTNPDPVYYPEVKEDKTVTFTFVRESYQVVYNTPGHGNLKVEWQDKNGSTWNIFAGSPGTVYFEDRVRITATPDAHYTLKTLSITPDGEAPITEPTGSFLVGAVAKGMTVYAEFEPEKCNVTLKKIEPATVDQGEVVLKNGSNVLGKLTKEEYQKTISGVPYNAVLTVEVLTEVNYACDQLTAGGTDILLSRSFTLTGNVDVEVKITHDPTQFKVTKQNATPEGSDLKVKDVTGNTEVTYGDLYPNGTLLEVKAVQAAGDTCIWIKANDVSLSDGGSYTISGKDVHFTAGFVKKCTVKIVNPLHASITVKKDGIALADGDIVPAGSILEAEMLADAGAGCQQLKIGGVEQWNATIVPTVAPLVTSGKISYAIAANHPGGDIVFEGSAGLYYSVKYKASSYGSLQVFAGADLLTAGTSYWYEAGKSIRIQASETVAGWQLNTAKEVTNAAAPAHPVILSWVAASSNYQNTINSLDRNLDLSVLFEEKQYDVNLVVNLPAGKTLAEVANVSLTGGLLPLTGPGTTKVLHRRALTLFVSPGSGYEAEILDGADVKQKGMSALTYITPAVVEDKTLTVKIKPLYRVYYSANITKVTHQDGTILSSGDWAFEGEILKAYSIAPPVGKEGKILTVKNKLNSQLLASSAVPLPNGTFECEFSMPALDVDVDAEFQLLTYDLALTLDTPPGAGIAQVYKIEAGGDTPLLPGVGVLSHGDQLKVVVVLAKDWYKTESLSVLMNGANVSTASSASGLTCTYTLNAQVSGSVNITAVLKRQLQSLVVRVGPGSSGFAVKVQVDGGSPVEYSQEYQSVQVPVGATVEAWPVISPTAPDGYELNYFPGSGLKETYVNKTVPLAGLSLSAMFTLKKYPLNIIVSPAGAGMVKVQDNTGVNYKHTDKVPYGTDLSVINTFAASEYYRLQSISGWMAGADRLTGQTAPYHIDKVVDSVGIEAKFSRLYKVLKETSVDGSMDIYEGAAPTTAEGRLFPASTALLLQVHPQDANYKCTFIQLSFPGTALSSQSLIPAADGSVSYTIPEGLNATDLKFQAFFVKKEYKVKLKRLPAEGGSAELWQGEKPTGTLLLSLAKDALDTEVEMNVAHGTILNFYETPFAPDYEVAQKVTGASNIYTGAVTLTHDTVFLVRFGKLYTVNIVDPGTIHVYRKDTGVEVASGTKIPAGTELTVRAEKTGHNYTLLSISKMDNTVVTSWNTTDANGVIEEEFVMTDFDINIAGVTEPKKFTVTIVQPDPSGYISIAVQTVPASGPSVVVGSGDKVEYLTSLLAQFTPHSWYEAGAFTATVGGVPRGVENPAGTLNIGSVDGDVVISAVSVRKQKKLAIKLQTELLAVGNKVIVLTEDGTEHTFTADGDIMINVGAPVKVWAVPGEGTRVVSLSPVPGIPVTAAPYELEWDNMPEQELTVTARFALKTYPVNFASTVGGSVVITKQFNGIDEGTVTVSGEEVKHFTVLTVTAVPASNKYQLAPDGLTTRMGGVAVPDPGNIPVVEDEVDINATFERIYEVRRVASVNGSITISRADTNAVGKRYPAGVALNIESVADEGYELVSLTMNGATQTMGPDGKYTCTIPDRPAVDSVEFKASYALKNYKITYIVSGEGALKVGGLPGGVQIIEKVTLTSSNIPHFTSLSLSVEPKSDIYRVSKFIVHFPDGSQKSVSAADTTIVMKGNSTIEVEFKKYYWVVYDAVPPHGRLAVETSGEPVVSGTRYPGETTFDVRTTPDEGYQLEALTANGEPLLMGSVSLPLADAPYDTMRIAADFKIIPCQLGVSVPDSAWVKIERLTAAGEWETLDVTNPVVLDYWTQIRITAGVYNEYAYELKALKVNGDLFNSDGIWIMKGDCQVVAEIDIRKFPVVWREPLYGKLEVKVEGGATIVSGTGVPYRTPLTVTALPDDPLGYEVLSVTANGNEIGNDGSWTVVEETELKGVIALRRWEVTTSVTGQGQLQLYRHSGSVIQSPVDSIEHYETLKISSRPEQGWMLYSLDVFGANMQADSTLTVAGDVQVVAEYRQREKYQFPAVFTPNGDGYNDLWEVVGLWQAPHNTLEIYNRDQQRIYKVSPYMNEWGGMTDNGNTLPAGTYIYKFTVSPGGEEYMGFISIVRE